MPRRTVAVLVVLLALGLALRFWRLGHEALWSDEILTAVFAAGHSLGDVPVGRALDQESVGAFFRLNPAAGPASIARAVATDSTHPPLAFWLWNWWMSVAWDGRIESIAWFLRSLAVLISGVCLVAIYIAGRVASPQDGPRVGVLAAALFACSPLGVFLAQQGRYYTLAMLSVIVSMIGHAAVCRDVAAGRRPAVRALTVWAAASVAGFYVNFLVVIAWWAQVVLLGWMAWKWRPRARVWLPVVAVAAGVMLAWAPAVPWIIGYAGRPEVQWIASSGRWTDVLADLVSALMALSAFAAVPLRTGITGLTLVAGALVLAGLGWVGVRLARGVAHRDQAEPAFAWAAALTVLTLATMILLGWVTHSNLTSVLRYHYLVLPPALLAVAALVAGHPPRGRTSVVAVLLLAGVAGSVTIASGSFLEKYVAPRRTAGRIVAASGSPVVFVWEYRHMNHIALGLSVGLELVKADARARLVFLPSPADGDWTAAVSGVVSRLDRPADVWSGSRVGDFDSASGPCRMAPTQLGKVSGKGFYHLHCGPVPDGDSPR